MSYFELTKTNRLKKPSHLQKVDSSINDKWNWCGQPHAQIGDYVLITGGSVSAGTVGKVTDIQFNYIAEMNAQGHQLGEHYTSMTPATIEFLDGRTEKTWLWYLTVIDSAAVQEVKDFYIRDGHPERIKVSW